MRILPWLRPVVLYVHSHRRGISRDDGVCLRCDELRLLTGIGRVVCQQLEGPGVAGSAASKLLWRNMG